MVVKKRQISYLIEDQLPSFISTEYPQFVRFLEKYYEQTESQGQPLDVINNIEKYRDIDFYEENLLNQSSSLDGIVNATDTTITLIDGSSFPEKNGYVKIDDEICFYKSRTENVLSEVSRGVSGNTTLGDLYESTEFVTTQAASHQSGTLVYNISNLFLYALVKNFEYENLASFPEAYLKREIDKRTLIKNITDFYKVKGTESSIKFVFNSIIARDIENVPTTYNPKDYTLKASTSDWTTTYSLKVKLVSGEITDLIGNQIVQNDGLGNFASAIVDNVRPAGGIDDEQMYEVILNPATVNGKFKSASRTKLEKNISSSAVKGDRVTVESTLGWSNAGSFYVNNEKFTFVEKNVKQFYIDSRSSSSSHSAEETIYDYVPVKYGTVELMTFGVLYNLRNQTALPYSEVGDSVQISAPGFETKDRVIYDFSDDTVRWFVNEQNTAPTALTNSNLQSQLQKYIADVSSIYEDDQFYYICSSGYPSYDILTTGISASLVDPKNLKIIRKVPIQTTEVYETSQKDVGVFVDGSLAFSYKDDEFVKYGNIVKTSITQKGSGYKNAPYVLINNVAGKATAIRSGETIESIVVDDNTIYTQDPEITVTSGRNAEIRAVVTNGKVTSLVITNPGEYYSTPPTLVITDRSGKGRFASYQAVVSESGQIVDYVQVDKGKLYTQSTTEVSIIPQGSGASATAQIRRWVKNRYKKFESSLDQANGYIFDDLFTSNGKRYGIVANPLKLRYKVGDNLNSLLQEPSTKTHSKILGYAYDGNPIYGPFGYSDPGDSTSAISRITSGYNLKIARADGPSTTTYPLGTFIDDYQWTQSKDTGRTKLDKNNGRYCVTPEYPEGTYAYFISTDSSNNPTFPYLLGENFYSLPVSSNYDSLLSQDEVPRSGRRLNYSDYTANGYNSSALIKSTTKGTIFGASVESSPNIFSVGRQVVIDQNSTTSGSGATASVKEVYGKDVEAIEALQTRVIKITTSEPVYFFNGDTVTQEVTGATGTVYGNSFNSTEFVLRSVSGTFNTTNQLNSNKTIQTLILDKQGDFSAGSTISLFDGVDSIIATATVLETINNQNSLKISVLTGTFIVDDEYSIVSNNLTDTPGSKILSILDLSKDIDVFSLKTNVALLRTNEEHLLGVNNKVNITIDPDDSTTETTYYVRKKKYQRVNLVTPGYFSTVEDTGIGRIDTLVAGSDYASTTYGGGTFTNVEVLFSNQNNARNAIGQTVGNTSDAVIGIEDAANNAKATVAVGYTKTVSTSNSAINTITVNDISNIFVGLSVKGQNIANNTVVSSINVDTKVITLTNSGTNNIITGSVASVVFNPGVISSVIITDKGQGYRRGDGLTFKDEDLDKVSSVTERSYIAVVDHVGFSSTDSSLFLTNVRGLSNNDLLKVGTEIVKITSVDSTNNKVTVNRAQNNTSASDHYNGTTVGLVNPLYRFVVGSQLGDGNAGDPYVESYDEKTQTLFVSYAYGVSNPSTINLSTSFDDASTPSKRVNIVNLIDINNRFQYSSDNTNFDILSGFELQRNYSYKFDTSHSSMANTFFDFSYSINKNVIALDTFRSNISPGNSGSYIKIKPGVNYGYLFGSTFGNNNVISGQSLVTEKEESEFARYYFFDRNDDVETFNNYFPLVEDPLQGEKTVIFTTNNGFLYEYTRIPQYDGSGSIEYTTTNKSAIGSIKSINIDNVGSDYNSIPSVIGIVPSKSLESLIEISYDSINNRIGSITLSSSGSNYVNPKAVIIGNGSEAKIELVLRNGKIVSAILKNRGKGYTEKPIVKVVETSTKVYLTSLDIGLPESVKVENSGFLYTNDNTLSRKFFSNTILVLSNFVDDAFAFGEELILENNGTVYATAKVAKNGWKNGSNILKVTNVTGTFFKGLTLKGKARGNTATILDVFKSTFTPNIKTYYDNIGFYTSDRGKLSANSQRITDSYFYQDYSYVVRSKTPINVWRNLIKETTHPAGFKLFGEVLVETSGQSTIANSSSNNFTIINLEPKTVSNLSTRRTIKESFVNFNNLSDERGVGSVSVDNQSNSETYATEVILSASFDGEYDENTGKVVGTKTFTLLDKQTNSALTPYNEEQLLITIDGVVQDPGVAFTVSGSSITFASAPLGERISEGQDLPAQSFYGRSFKYKSDTLNAEYLKKVRNFFQRSGRWLDTANQIRFNKDFIVEESIGYVVDKYPNLPWNLYRSKCVRDIRYILDAYEHDLRFGGNSKTIGSAELYYSGNTLQHINSELTETLAAFKYAAKLSAAAMRNWDYTITNAVISTGDNLITVPSTFGIVVGMNVSSGSQFPEGTVVTEIVNDTQVRVSNNARDIVTSSLNVPAGTTEIITIDSTYAGVISGGTIEVDVISGGMVTLTSTYAVNSIPQVTFSLSKINNGTFYDASNLIEKNKLYIKEETLGWIKNQYPSLVIPNETKCQRDTGYLVDAVVHSLRYGGTQKIINFAKAYYNGNTIQFIDTELTESVKAFEYAIELMILAMRNTLPAGTYSTESPFTDSSILTDPNEYFPKCYQVESALNSYSGIVNRLLSEGINLIQAEPENDQRAGNWTTLKTYSNYNLIPDPLLLASECNNVEDSIQSLYSGIESTLSSGIGSVTKTRPDYIDGENTDFEIFYEDGSNVRTNSTEDLLVFVNGVIQLPGTYEIVRSGTTDFVSFSSPPKWEQESNVITVQEPLALDKTFVVRVGSYETLTINAERISIKKTGPFVLFDRETGNIRAVDDSNYAYVFIDGVLQKKDISYTLNGSTITFKEPVTSHVLPDGTEVTQRVDVLVLYGRDLEKKLTFYDYEPDTYYNKIDLRITDNTISKTLLSNIENWFRESNFIDSKSPLSKSRLGLFLLEINSITGKTSKIGEIKKVTNSNSGYLDFVLSGDNVVDLDANGTYTLCLGGYINDPNKLSFTASPDILVSFSYLEDSEGNRNLVRNVTPRFYDTGKSYEIWEARTELTANLRVGDKIKIDGESSFRNIVSLPELVNLKDFREGKEVSNEIYGTVGATNYNGLTRGLGLGVIAQIDNGSVSNLVWNKRDLQLFIDYQIRDKETAIGYYAAPFVQFIPVDGNGGGASAEVLVVNKSIVDIVITNTGSGYTQPPRVVISRGYTRIKNNRKVDYVTKLDIVPKLDVKTVSVISSVSIIGSISPSVVTSYEILNSPVSVDRFITEIITPEEKNISLSSQREIAILSTLNVAAEAFTLFKVETLSTTIVESEVKEIKVSHTKTLNVEKIFTGTVDKEYSEYDDLFYSQNILGNRLVCFESSKFIDTGYSDVSRLTIEEFSLAYPECIIGDFDIPDTVKVTTTIDNKFNLGYPSIQNYGSLLDISIDETDDIIYISDTSVFPSEGLVLIGDEIISYTSKFSDRFLGVTRGVSGTVAQSHTAGDYLRTF